MMIKEAYFVNKYWYLYTHYETSTYQIDPPLKGHSHPQHRHHAICPWCLGLYFLKQIRTTHKYHTKGTLRLQGLVVHFLLNLQLFSLQVKKIVLEIYRPFFYIWRNNQKEKNEFLQRRYSYLVQNFGPHFQCVRRWGFPLRDSIL